jgi:DNA-binding transcriptional regulator YiaG
LGISQRSVSVEYDDSKERYSPRKLIPVNLKTLGDHLLLKRIEANLTQPELGQQAGVSARTVRKWEHGHACPTEDHWQALSHIFSLDLKCTPEEAERQSSLLGFTEFSMKRGFDFCR